MDRGAMKRITDALAGGGAAIELRQNGAAPRLCHNISIVWPES